MNDMIARHIEETGWKLEVMNGVYIAKHPVLDREVHFRFRNLTLVEVIEEHRSDYDYRDNYLIWLNVSKMFVFGSDDMFVSFQKTHISVRTNVNGQSTRHISEDPILRQLYIGYLNSAPIDPFRDRLAEII